MTLMVPVLAFYLLAQWAFALLLAVGAAPLVEVDRAQMAGSYRAPR